VTIAPIAAASTAAAGLPPQSGADASAAVAAAASNAPPLPVAAQAGPVLALEAAVQAAAGRQSGLAPLMADLEVALQTPGLPAPVLAAATQALGLRLPLDPPPTAADLRQAMAQSGLFLEAQLASPEAAAGPDLKAVLLSLDQALLAWLGAAPAQAATAAPPPPAPPFRDGPFRGQAPAAASLAPDTPPEALGARLLQETGGALARQLLLQAAALPDQPRPTDPAAQGAQWRFELPLMTPQGAAIAQFEIARDGHRAAGGEEAPPVWRAGFSLHLEPMGPVHGKIALSGERVRVSLWAETGETVDRLAAQSANLSSALLEAGLTAQVNVASGAPSPPPPPPAGRLVDRAV
jgi:hypothetical protein